MFSYLQVIFTFNCYGDIAYIMICGLQNKRKTIGLVKVLSFVTCKSESASSSIESPWSFQDAMLSTDGKRWRWTFRDCITLIDNTKMKKFTSLHFEISELKDFSVGFKLLGNF